jgi:hypothetical protein
MATIDDILSHLPHYWDKKTQSVTYQMLLAIADELDAFKVEKDNLVLSIQIDTAVGTELDDIGELFKLARRTGESDTDYRVRIKNARLSFIGGGTIPGLKNAFEAATGLPQSQLDITDEFDLKFLATITVNDMAEILLLPIAEDTILASKAAGIGVLFAHNLIFHEDLSVSDTITITPLSAFNEFIIEVSEIEGTDVIS